MKKLALILVAFCAILISANAQEGRPQGGDRSERPSFEEMQKRQLEQMKTDLALTEAQVPEVKAINEAAGKKFQELFQNRQQGQDRDAMRQKMTEIRTEQNNKLKEVLTEEQYTKWVKLQEERMQQRRENRGQRPEGNNPERSRGQARGNNF